MPSDDKTRALGINDNGRTQDELDRDEAIRSLDRTGEMPFMGPDQTSTQLLPAYAPPNEAYHPDARIKGRWWLVAAASLVGLVVAASAWGTSSRVSSVGLLGVEKAVVEEVVAESPAQQGDTGGTSAGKLEGLATPDVATPESVPAMPTTPETTPPADDPAPGLSPSDESSDGGTYGFTWPDDDGNWQDYSLTVPSDPESGDGTFGFSWPDDDGGSHEFSYRHDDGSLTFRYDDEELSLSLEELEELLGGSLGDGWYDYPDHGYGYGDGHGPGGSWDGRAPGYGGDGGYSQARPGWNGSGMWS